VPRAACRVQRRPTLWQRARYVVAKVMAAVLSAIGALYPASWLFFVQYKEVDIFTDSWYSLPHSPRVRVRLCVSCRSVPCCEEIR
jgi:hypothetical protein